MKNQESICSLKGIGDKTAKLFEKLGIHTIEELIHDYPRAYQAYDPPVSIGELEESQIQAVAGILQKDASVRRFQRIQVITVSLKDQTGSVQLTWYNMPFLRNTIQSGTYHIFYGKVTRKNNRLTMEQPEIYTRETYAQVAESMQPVYGQTKGLSNKTISKAVAQALDLRDMERDYLPAELRRKYELAEYNFAVEHIHFPANRQKLLFARKRLVFDEFFLFLTGVRKLKEKREDMHSHWVMKLAPEVKKLKDHLPYHLTDAQEKVLNEVEWDLGSGLVMNRLIQGDVGSGKTIIAVLALLHAAYNGFQGALMVPTEVLAKQHYESMLELFEAHGIDKVPVQYDKLALVITDEQHRFGVGQREMLGNKGEEPHVLVMSATPIPRTLAIILYGDLDISIIDKLPSNRLPIKNCVVDTGYREKAYAFIRKQVEQGRQAYVICPMVEASEMIEAENVLDYSARLKEALPGICVEYLHGKMKGKEKNQIMERFAAGEIQVLVSTTVIEVGVNVPNATVMMIENAERFGLAQLHQLRGRVGRGKYQSYCIMVNCGDQDGTQKRLDILNRSNDGFYIASEDLKLRGPGDIFGVRQSGDLEFKIADIFTDANLLKTVSEEVNRLLDEDPELEMEEHRDLKEKMDRYLSQSYEKLNL